MEVLLLGTGSADGWPAPGCRCASCAVAATRRLSRAPTCVLVDDVLLLDPAPELARQAASAGRVLSSVRTVLLSGLVPPVPSVVAGLAAQGPVQVLGTEAALAAYAACGAVHPRAQLVLATPGEVLQQEQHALLAVAQGATLGWDVRSPSGVRLLHAPGADPVAAAAQPFSYDAVLLAAGSMSGTGRVLAGLRRSGSVTDATDVLVVGIGHGHGPPDAVAEQLRGWGARTVPDGTVLHVGDAPAADAAGRAPLPARTLVLGGARSGKSALAEQLLAAQPAVLYVATGGSRDGDDEWRRRVALHVARRPAWWRTVETVDVADCLRTADSALLIDCLGTWLTARLDRHGVWDGGPLDAVEADITELVLAWRAAAVPVVAVSNEVGSGVVPATASGRLFRDLLGRLNATLAAESETVLLTVAGIAVPLRTRPGP